MNRLIITLFTGFAAFGVVSTLPAAEPAATGPLTLSPASVRLTDLFAREQVLASVPGKFSPVDVTTIAKYETADPQVARVDSRGTVQPISAGKTTITVRHGNEQATLAVEVQLGQADRPVHFSRDVQPILTRFGCNSGGCHGKASGQNGFRLSLFGFDDEFDYQALVLEGRGRRVFPAAPDTSLLLAKGSGRVPHGGGNRLSPDREAYQVLRRWIAQGMPREATDAPRLVSLSLEPKERILGKGQLQQLRAVVTYSDGSTRDVTRQTQFESNHDAVAIVNADGLVETAEGTGEAAIMARYMGTVAVFKAVAPLGEPLNEIADFKPANYVDELVLAKWKRLGIRPSPPADDATFLRRITVDLTGRLPTVAESQAFLSDTARDKRAKLVDKLLESPDHAAYFAMRWGTILRNSRLAGADQAAYAFNNWLRDQVARNRPYDEMVRGIVAASGEWQDAPAINWFWQMRDDQLHQSVSDTAQVFLGLRLQCARCHHHPYERWSQDDYYGLAGYFMRLGRKGFGEPPPYYASRKVTNGEKNPRTGKTPEPKPLDGPVVEIPADQDPRHVLVDWMSKPENPFFAKALVNRLWGHMMGMGIVDPIDDLRETNPPSNPELLDALSKDFVARKFDMRHVLRTIANSQAYQLSSEPTPSNASDSQNFARYYARRLVAETMLDAVDQVCGTQTNFNNMPASARAVDLPHEGFGSYFLDTFGRPRRVSGCECERSSGANVSQVLLLSNSDEIENKVASDKGRLGLRLKEKKPTGEVVEEIYLAAFSRKPTETERTKTASYIASKNDPKRALEDILWTLLNSKEFILNH